MADLVTIAGIGKSFRNGVTALEGVDLGVAEGEFLSVLGPSGRPKGQDVSLPNLQMPVLAPRKTDARSLIRILRYQRVSRPIHLPALNPRCRI